ncbi:hypothetical protein GLOIN_2v1847703 [Rhizophagus irregularis DAOM 181602=DAOM 197198]|uniref:SWIM-type domain-containing protein n=2 Tax=Rhizophagus irregularis TaxID=588596 RepID=A0A2P4P4E6_RHIID|nr:hypothetical protein GLOIN_2v1847703 [Rhizophagus irregularis DAOM 181602=DAOM 197198]POG60244.1 hypothetical protein GLOIN_2v1847703 [Rhizophagus irregularis DAOM 181602=DAOM 197198]|eukprot:XP_025167110.1 hypothetical protein GLOIN_2v1847703 [Rhizophagus irregularis DAOM 181602=DAOM 197198]
MAKKSRNNRRKTMDISLLDGDSKQIANTLVGIIADVDEYSWVYNTKYDGKQESVTYWYVCSQRVNLEKQPRKHQDLLKQRDTPSMNRFNCEGYIRINVNQTTNIAKIEVNHNYLHPPTSENSVSEEIKMFIQENIDLLPCEIYAKLINKGLDLSIKQKQIHFWWTKFNQNRYIHHENSFQSALIWMKEQNYYIILNLTEPVQAIAFTTGIYEHLKKNNIHIHECDIDATYNTNNLKFELYVIHAKVDGVGFPLAYLFLENNGNCGNGTRTDIINMFCKQMKLQGLNPEFLLTDKDFAQITASQRIWILSSSEIWKLAVNEMYMYCEQHSLPFLWAYMWKEWYCAERWVLWMRAGCENKISVLKTTMIVESHWKVLKRDFLYKFFRPQLDLVVFIITKKMLKHQERRFNQLAIGREKPERRKIFKSEWKRLAKHNVSNDFRYITDPDKWICGCLYYLTSHFFICKHLIQQKGEILPKFFDHIKRNNQYPFLENADNRSNSTPNTLLQLVPCVQDECTIHEELTEDDSDAFFDELISITKPATDLLEEHKFSQNIKWGKGVEKNFNSIRKMVQEVETYR